MLTLEMIIAMLGWPALATALVLTSVRVPAVASSRFAVLVAPAAIVAGFLVGFGVVLGVPELLPAADAKAHLPHVALLALGLAALAAFTERRIIHWPALLLGSLAMMRLVLGAAIEFEWTMVEAIGRVFALAIGMVATTLLAADFLERVPRRTGSLGLAVIAGVAAPIMLFSDSLLMAQLHGVLGISVGVVAIAVWLAPARLSLRATAPVVVAITWSHWLIGLLFANMPLASFILLSAAPPAASLAARALRRWSPRHHAFAALVTLGVLVAGALAVGGLRYARTAAPDVGSSDESHASYGYYE